MAHIGAGVEYALHCLLNLVEPQENGAASTRDLAEFQGVSPSYLAKLFTRLEKTGLVRADGRRPRWLRAGPSDGRNQPPRRRRCH